MFLNFSIAIPSGLAPTCPQKAFGFFRYSHIWWIRKKSNFLQFVIPAKAGIQLFQSVLDSGFRRSDGFRTFYKTIIFQFSIIPVYSCKGCSKIFEKKAEVNRKIYERTSGV
ncbi:MAG: hypothetical protein A2157_10445 [Deltaproteobacteria bacterium RBG_16_47_11]|nr:MAG: hypothetical protein A2157_10445 [Deltaproteobacteria bacterium RBG_16_47_11]